MIELRTAILKDYGTIIDYIMAVLEPGSKPALRDKVVTSLQRALTQSHNRGGKIHTPRDTGLYKFAHLMHECQTMEEFVRRFPIVFHNHFSQYKQQLPYVFGFEWKPAHISLANAWGMWEQAPLPEPKKKMGRPCKPLPVEVTKPQEIVSPPSPTEPPILIQIETHLSELITLLKSISEALNTRLGVLEQELISVGNEGKELAERLTAHTHTKENGSAVIVRVEKA